MGDTICVEILKCADKLLGHHFDGILWKHPPGANECSQVSSWNKFHDDVEFVVPINVLDEANDIWLGVVSKDLMWEYQAYVVDFPHDIHLHVHLLI